MAKIKKIYDDKLSPENPVEIYPITSTQAVYNTENVTVDALIAEGYRFGGLVEPTDSPALSDTNQRAFYFATKDGIYPNFGNQTVENGRMSIFLWNGSAWGKQSLAVGSANIAGYKVLASVNDLPRQATNLGYLIEDTTLPEGVENQFLYVWVGEGGDTLEGMYQNCGQLRGASAYEVARDNGYEGTQEEWLNDPVNGIKGVGISKWELSQSTADSGVSTITVTLNTGDVETFDVYNGKGIASVEVVGSESSADSATNTYRVTYSDGNHFDFHTKNGKGIASIAIVGSYSDADGATNTYRVTYSDGNHFDFNVKNGNKGDSGYSGAAGELEVVNSLNSTDATAALSAAQGKVLKDLHDTDKNIVNVNDLNGTPTTPYQDADAARIAISPLSGLRITGQIITYLLADGWHTEQFIGSDVNNWTTASNWLPIAPITVTQNTETGHTDISVGGVTTPVASVEEVSQLGEEVDSIPILPGEEITNIYPNDLDFSDGNDNIIVEFKDGHIRTKNFDSSGIERENLSDDLQNELPKLEDNGLVAADFDVVDEDDDVILSVLNGYPKTKNFNGKEISDKTKVTEWAEKWSRMPSLEDNPLAKVRFDGGMCRIFRKWGFVGDSLCSGTMNGYVVTELSYTEIANKAISEGAIVNDNTSTVSDNVTLVGRYPGIKMVFQSNSGLNGKVLLASYSNGTYTPLIVGGIATEYQNVTIANDSVIAVSYPSSNVPRILLSVDGTQQANYEISWGQQLVRLLGAEGYNFSIGGEYAKRWCVGGAGGSSNRNWEKAQQTDELKDVYVIGLGVNDRAYWFAGQTSIVNYPCVTAYPNVSDYAQTLVLSDNDVMDDIDLSDYTQNANSYAGWYAGIIQRLKSVRKDAYIFCCTLPDGYPSMDKSNAYSQVVRKIVEKLNEYYGDKTIWLIDFETYNPITSEVREKIYNDSHLTAFGYLYYAYQFTSYIDWIIRNNVADFKNVPFIGTTTVAERFDDFKV